MFFCVSLRAQVMVFATINGLPTNIALGKPVTGPPQ